MLMGVCWDYSHSLKLALYGVYLGLFARFFGIFDRDSPLYLWFCEKRYQNGINDTTRKARLSYGIHYTIKSE